MQEWRCSFCMRCKSRPRSLTENNGERLSFTSDYAQGYVGQVVQGQAPPQREYVGFDVDVEAAYPKGSRWDWEREGIFDGINRIYRIGEGRLPTGLVPVEANVELVVRPRSLNFIHHRHPASARGRDQWDLPLQPVTVPLRRTT